MLSLISLRSSSHLLIFLLIILLATENFQPTRGLDTGVLLSSTGGSSGGGETSSSGGDDGGIFNNNSSTTNTPIIDSVHVPLLIRDYDPDHTLSPLPLISSSGLTSAPVRTPNYAWYVDSGRNLFSIRIGGNDTKQKPNAILRSTEPFTNTINSKCLQPVISPARTQPYTLYVVCAPNLIFTVTAIDSSGDFVIDYVSPIRVKFTNSSSTTPNLTKLVAVPQKTGPDLFIASGGGAIFTINSQTGENVRPQFGPGFVESELWMGSLTDIVGFFPNTTIGGSSMQLQCLCKNSYGQIFTTLLVWSNRTGIAHPWYSSYNYTFTGSGAYVAVQMYDSPTTVHYYAYGGTPSSQQYFRFDKATQIMSTFIGDGSSTVPLLTIYEPIGYAGLALASTEYVLLRLDYNSKRVTTLSLPPMSGYFRYLVIEEKDQIIIYGSRLLLVFKLSSLLSQGTPKFDYIWSYRYAQTTLAASATYGYSNYPQFDTFYDNFFLLPGLRDENVFLVYNSEYSLISYSYYLRVRVITSSPALSCQQLPQPSYLNTTLYPNIDQNSKQCACNGLTSSQTARWCRYDSVKNICQDSFTEDTSAYCSEITDIGEGEGEGEGSWGNGVVIIIIFIVIVPIVLGCCVLCCVSWLIYRCIQKSRQPAHGPLVIGGIPPHMMMQQHQQPYVVSTQNVVVEPMEMGQIVVQQPAAVGAPSPPSYDHYAPGHGQGGIVHAYPHEGQQQEGLPPPPQYEGQEGVPHSVEGGV